MSNQDNIDKCQGRRNTIAEATPRWLTEQQKAQIREMYSTCKELNKIGDQKYHVDHIVPLSHPLVCGLHVPWNLQILTAEDNRKKGNGLQDTPTKGAITIDQLGGSLRYKGRFIKGFSGNTAGRPATTARSNEDIDPEFQQFMDSINSGDKDPSNLIEDMSLWMIRNARSREEAYRYMKDFAPYFKAKLSNVEAVDESDKTFVVEIRGPGGSYENKSEGNSTDS